MLNLIHDSLAGQYGAALGMLRSCLERADAVAWVAPVGRFPVGRVAYHVMLSTDRYLARDEAAFRPPPFHHEGDNFLDPPGGAAKVVVEPPHPREMLLTYLDGIVTRAKESVAAETEESLKGPSGFSWLSISRLELHVYNLRHLQHHVGVLAAAVQRAKGEGTRWIRSQPPGTSAHD